MRLAFRLLHRAIAAEAWAYTWAGVAACTWATAEGPSHHFHSVIARTKATVHIEEAAVIVVDQATAIAF